MPMELQSAPSPIFPITDITAREHSVHQNPSDQRRALQVSSGNIQLSALDTLTPDNFNKGNPSELDQVRPQRNNKRTAAAARIEHRKKRRTFTVRAEGTNRKYDISRYRQYRDRVAKNKDIEDDKRVWPPELEEAFIEGHEIVGPIGRQKRLVNGRLHGRFQLIGEYVFRKTGEKRDRKQVSSHNQVLKGYLGTSRSFRKLLPPKNQTDDPNEDDIDSPDSLELFLAGLLPRNPHPNYLEERGLERVEHALPPGPALADTVTSPTQHVFPVDFAMWVQTPTGRHSGPDRPMADCKHIYTDLTASPMLDSLPLESLKNWRTVFPHLATLHDFGAVDCEMTLLEATLNMNVLSTSSTGSVLATLFETLANPAYAGHTWKCTTNIYCFGTLVWTMERIVPHADAGDGHVKLRPPFESDFWAHTFLRLAEGFSNGNREAAEERARIHIRSLSAVQELVATGTSYNGRPTTPKRAALYLWRFSTTKPGETEGQTTWRNLYPPPSRILANSPAPAPLNAASLQETLDLWEEQYGSDIPRGDSCILDFGQGPNSEPAMPPESAISMYYPNFDTELSQEENNMPFSLPLVPPEPFDEAAPLSAFLDSYPESTTGATYGSTTPPLLQDGPYRATSHWQRCLPLQSTNLTQEFAAPCPSFTDQLQDVTAETLNEDFGLVFG